jgi:nitroreductase
MKPDSKTTSRRRFVRGGIAVGGGLLAVPALGDTPAAGPLNDTLKTIHSLRSTHGNFSAKQVPEKELQLILDATVRAANASNTQSYSIIVVKDAAQIQRLTGYRGNCMLLYCADHNRLIDTAKHLGYDFYADNLESFVTSSTNTILAAQTAVIAARSLGIDSLLTNGIHRGDMERIWSILGLPQKACFPLIALILGYATSDAPYRKGRLRGPGVIHNGRYQRLAKDELDELVRQYDDKSQHLALNEDWERGGHKHYHDWFFKEWNQRDTKPAANEGQIFKRLKKSGYIDMQGA